MKASDRIAIIMIIVGVYFIYRSHFAVGNLAQYKFAIGYASLWMGCGGFFVGALSK